MDPIIFQMRRYSETLDKTSFTWLANEQKKKKEPQQQQSQQQENQRETKPQKEKKRNLLPYLTASH